MVTNLLKILMAGTALAAVTPALAKPVAADGPQTGEAAQDAAPAGPAGADIIVTATRRSESLQKTPVTVNVVGGADLKKYNLFDFKDIQALTPGLQLSNDDGRSNSATLRGINFDPDSGTLPAVDVFFNEISVDPQTAFTSIYDVSQIEVLRGPQGLYRGTSSPAGSITLTTAKPNLDKNEGYVQATGSSLAGYNFQGAASLVLKKDVLAMRAAIDVDGNRANGVRNVSGERGRNRTESARLSLSYQPTSNFHADLMYQYLTSDVRPFIAVFGAGNQPSLLDPSRSGPALTLDDRRSVTEGAPRFQNETHLVTFHASYDFGGANLIYNGGYQNTQLTQYRDQDVANAVPNYQLPQLVITPYYVWSNELRLESNSDGPLTWALSGNYDRQLDPTTFSQRNDQLLGTAFTPIPPAFGVVPVQVDGSTRIIDKTHSVAGSASYAFTPRLKLMAGLRYTWFHINQPVETVVTAAGTTFDSITPLRYDTRFLTGGANLSYEVTPDVSVYASYGRSARPGAQAVGVSVPLDAKYLQTPDETSNGGEFGIKTKMLNGALTLNGDIFYQKFNNYISYAPCLTSNSSQVPGVVDTSCAPLPTFGNAISKGLEIELDAHPTRNFDFGLSASYADAHYDHAQVYCNDYNGDGVPDSNGTPSVPGTEQVATCTRNDRLAQVPKFNLSGNAELRQPIGDDMDGFIRTLVTYRPAFYSQDDDYNFRAYTNIALYVGLRGQGSKWEASLFVKNLLDQTRVTSVSQGTGQYGTVDYSDPLAPVSGAPFDSGYRTAVINLPREFGATLAFHW